MNKIILILFLLICTSFLAGAQNEIISADSLNILSSEFRQTDSEKSLQLARAAWIISSQQNDTEAMAASLLNMGMAQYKLSRFDSAIVSCKKSYHLYKSIGHSIGMTAAANNLGMVYYQMSDFANAEKYYSISLDIDYSLNDTAGMAYGLNNLGQLFQYRGDYQKALQYYMLSAEIEHQSGNPYGEAHSWLNIGSAYSESGNLSKGNEYYRKALEYFSSVSDSRNLALVLINLGDNFRLNHDFAQARNMISKAIEISTRNKNDIELIQAQIYYSKLLSDENKADSAEFWLFEALNRCVETDNNLLACEALMQQGLVLSAEKKYPEANQYLLNAYEFASDMQYASALKTILEQLSNNYSALGDFEEALKYQKMGAANDQTQVMSNSAAKIKKDTNPEKPAMMTLLYGLVLGAFLILLLATIHFYIRMRYYKKLTESHSPAREERK